LISNNGSQPTAVNFTKECNILGINQVFTIYNNPKGNADTERLIRTFKEELVGLTNEEIHKIFLINWIVGLSILIMNIYTHH
jgi:hypothetical protein